MNLTMIISTCEKYNDLWEENIRLLNKNWDNRDFRVILVTDSKRENCNFHGVELFSAGGRVEMPQRIIACLKMVQTDYVLYAQDDYFLTKPISSRKIQKLLQSMEKLQLDYLRLYPFPIATKRVTGESNLFWLNNDRSYDVNLYPGIWRKECIAEAFNQEVDIWNLEVSLTKFAVNNKLKCVMIREKVFPFLDVIEKGKIHYIANKYLNTNGIRLNRIPMTLLHEIRHQLAFHARSIMPKKIFIIVKKCMKALGHKFYSDMY